MMLARGIVDEILHIRIVRLGMVLLITESVSVRSGRRGDTQPRLNDWRKSLLEV